MMVAHSSLRSKGYLRCFCATWPGSPTVLGATRTQFPIAGASYLATHYELLCLVMCQIGTLKNAEEGCRGGGGGGAGEPEGTEFKSRVAEILTS